MDVVAVASGNSASGGEGGSVAASTVDVEWKNPVYGPTDKYTSGIAPIKKQYVLARPATSGSIVGPVVVAAKAVDDDAVEGRMGPSPDPEPAQPTAASEVGGDDPSDPNASPTPKKLKGAARKRARRQEAAALAAAQRAAKKAKAPAPADAKKGGQNKNRQFTSLKDAKGYCHGFLTKGREGCKFRTNGGCRFDHDLVGYLSTKAKDIHLPPAPTKKVADMSEQEKSRWFEERYSVTLIPSREAASLEDGRDGDDEEEEGGATFVRTSSSRKATTDAVAVSQDPAHHSLDFTTSCPIYAAKGFCTMGWKCRFLGSHVSVVGPSKLSSVPQPTGYDASGLEMLSDPARVEAWRHRPRAFVFPNRALDNVDQDELNFGTSAGMKSLRVRRYPLPRTKAVLTYLDAEANVLAKADPQGSTAGKGPIRIELTDSSSSAEAPNGDGAVPAASAGDAPVSKTGGKEDLEEMENAIRNAQSSSSSSSVLRQAEAAASAAEGAVDVARIRPSEKRRLNWKGELYLAPLTTTGNLPFRRICSGYGSDIHCGEMGLAESFLHGNAAEWSLVRRWEGERIFGTSTLR